MDTSPTLLSHNAVRKTQYSLLAQVSVDANTRYGLALINCQTINSLRPSSNRSITFGFLLEQEVKVYPPTGKGG